MFKKTEWVISWKKKYNLFKLIEKMENLNKSILIKYVKSLAKSLLIKTVHKF